MILLFNKSSERWINGRQKLNHTHPEAKKDPRRLWIFGDSWSALWPDRDPIRVWTRQLSHALATELGEVIQLRNNSLVGSAQDWALNEFLKVVHLIDPNDIVIFILTSPARFWYFEDEPTISNWNIMDLDQHISSEQAKAIELFIKHIQRPHIDGLAMRSRLGLIAYEIARRGLNRALIIPGFDMDLVGCDQYEHLLFAQGNLSFIQWGEYKDKKKLDEMLDQGQSGYFQGGDCRYNHMCLCNHDVLVKKILDTLVKGQPLDLTSGFHTELIGPDWLSDQDLVDSELNPHAVEFFIKEVQTSKWNLPWKKRSGVEKVMQSRGYHAG